MTRQLCEPWPGIKLWVDPDGGDMAQLKAEGRYEWRKVDYIRQHLQPGMWFVDVGAHVGYFTVLAASIVYDDPEGLVLAWEPNGQNAYWLRRSLEANQFAGHVPVFHMAAGSDRGVARLYEGAGSGQHSTLPVSNYWHEVPANTLDGLGCWGDMIKIDVEGAELAVLQGAAQALTRAQHILLDLHPDLGCDPAPVEWLLLDAGFKLYDIRSDFAPIHFIPRGLVELLAVKP